MAPFKNIAMALVTALAFSDIAGGAAVPVPADKHPLGLLPSLSPNNNTKGDEVIRKMPKHGFPPGKYPKAIKTPTSKIPLNKLPKSKVPPKQDHHHKGSAPYERPWDNVEAEAFEEPTFTVTVHPDLGQPDFSDVPIYDKWGCIHYGAVTDCSDAPPRSQDENGCWVVKGRVVECPSHRVKPLSNNTMENITGDANDTVAVPEDTIDVNLPAGLGPMVRRDADHSESHVEYHREPEYHGRPGPEIYYYLLDSFRKSTTLREQATANLDILNQKMESFNKVLMEPMQEEQMTDRGYPIPYDRIEKALAFLAQTNPLKEALEEYMTNAQNETQVLMTELERVRKEQEGSGT